MGSQITKEEQLRKRILEIHNDESLSAHEKAKETQLLFGSHTKCTGKETREILQAGPEQTFQDKQGNVLGCQHYPRRAQIQAICCEGWFPCRFCHDEVSDHSIDRFSTKTMCCMVCFEKQPVAKDCRSCDKEMASFYCGVCKLWDDSPDKSFYHCNDCGICRVGKGLGIDFQHCKKCSFCISVDMFEEHRCIENNSKSDCPICGELLFSSRKKVIFMPCAHAIHSSCYRRLCQDSYQCPICSRSLGDMTDLFTRLDEYLSHPFPEEFDTKRRLVTCCDCDQRSVAKYHFLYHKCGHCGSYSTKILDTFEKDDSAYSQLGDVMPAATYTYTSPAHANTMNSANNLIVDSTSTSSSSRGDSEDLESVHSSQSITDSLISSLENLTSESGEQSTSESDDHES